MKDFANRTIWITGASSGIGRALAMRFLNEGARVIGMSQDEAGLMNTAKEARKHNGEFIPFILDLEKWEAVEEKLAPLIEKYPRADVLANIAGISQRSLSHETPLWIDQKIMNINYFGAISITKALLPLMHQQGEGHILATSSLTGKFGFPLRSAYCAAKHALHGFFETLYIENREKGIDVTLIIPGRVRTQISVNALEKDGKQHGKMDRGQAGGVSPEKAAGDIYKGIVKRKRTVHTGGKELLMLKIRKYLPSLFFRMAGRMEPM